MTARGASGESAAGESPGGSDELRLQEEPPTAEDVIALLARHLAFARGCTAPEDAHALDLEALQDPAVRFFTARRAGALLGVGALQHIGPGHFEVKSMHVAEAARRHGVGRAMLRHLMAAARSAEAQRISLETGTMQEFAAARALYREEGFQECGPFGSYAASANTVFMTLVP